MKHLNPTAKDTSVLLTVALAARRAGVSRAAVYLWVKRGLPIEFQGLQFRIRAQALDRWVAERRAEKVRA